MAFEGFDTHLIDVGDARLFVRSGGKGPPLLLLHGYPQTHMIWHDVALRLADRFHLVIADLRGYGRSTGPQPDAEGHLYSKRAMAADLAALMSALGHQRFSVAGHDRGGRVAYRLALDHPQRVDRLCVLDIVPTSEMWGRMNHAGALRSYHWSFLAQPAPLPERLIGNDPDFFFETSLVGWGKTELKTFDPEMLAEYRRCWRDPAAIHGMVSDYRAAATIDLAHDAAGIDRQVACPTLAFWGTAGAMHRLFDMKAEWQKRCANVETATLPGGHFFVDQFPEETAQRLQEFLAQVRSP